MKYLISCIAIILSQLTHAGSAYKCESISGTVYQQTPCANTAKSQKLNNLDQSPKKSICTSASETASAIMKARQNGADMASLTNNLLSSQSVPEMKDLIDAMIQAAYSKPRFNSYEYQQNAIQDFKNENYAACAKVTPQFK